MKRAAIFLCCAVAAAGWFWWRSETPRLTLDIHPNRNLLLVTIDTLRADALGSYGGAAITPNLDRLAAHGVRFDFAHAHAVVTLPSHASILTGRYPYEHGIRDNTGYRLASTQSTAATRLRTLGFATGAFIGGFPLERRFGLGSGFDVYDDRLTAAGGEEGTERERPASEVVSSALDWIDKQSGKWFVWVHLYDPHIPYEPPPEWVSRFPNDRYIGEVSWTDFALGRLFDRMGSQPRSTLVVVTSDHGESLGDHGELTHGVFAYESVLRVPLIVAEIGKSRAPTGAGGVIVEAPVRHVDLLPTLLEVLQAPQDQALPGTSLLELLGSGQGRARPAYFEAMTATVVRGWAPLRGVLLDREKFIDLPVPELYDLRADPRESNNLARARSGRVQTMRNVLLGFNMAAPGRPQQEASSTIERLRSLGYVAGGAAAARNEYTEADDPKKLIELDQMMTRAAQAYGRGQANEAIELYQTVIARRPDMEDAYRKLALVHWRAGRATAAIETLEQALNAGVTQAEVRNRLAQYLTQTGQPRKAITLLEHNTSDDPDALIALGNAYAASGRGGEARKTFERLLEVDPTNGLAWENIGVAQLQARDYASAEASLRRAIDVDPNLAGAHTALGVALASTGRRDEAIDAWKRAVALDGAELNALYNLTVNLAESGRIDEAETYGTRFVAAAPPDLEKDAAAIRQLLIRIRQAR